MAERCLADSDPAERLFAGRDPAEQASRRAARPVSCDEPRPQARALRRKVTASGVIWLDGRAYYVSRQLAGRTISVEIAGDRLVIDVLIPLRKEYRLPE